MLDRTVLADTARRRLVAFGEEYPLVIGRNGATADKREGDGKTPLGRFPLSGALLRPDRVAVCPGIAWRWLRPSDGWSDAPPDPAYNRPVSHPHSFSAEHLWRADHLYDVILVLGHNSSPVVPGRGSAVFFHVAEADGRPTAGCLAIPREDMLALLPKLVSGMSVEIR